MMSDTACPTPPTFRDGAGPLFRVVMHEPEIPNNTGNIGRTCIAMGCALHLIRPLGFDTSVKALRRAGLDYWPRLGVREHESWDAYCAAMGVGKEGAGGAGGVWLTSGKVGRPVWDCELRAGDHFVFGKETRGLPAEMLERHADRVVTIPMVAGERGLNVATVVCAVLCEGVRQCVARGEAHVDGAGRLVRSRCVES